MENKWLLLSVISDSDLGRSIDTIRIKSKYIALWYIFDKYLPLIILTKLILTLYVMSWLLLQSNRYLYLSLSLYLYIYLLTLIYSACRAFVNPYITHTHTHTNSYIVNIYIVYVSTMYKIGSHTQLKNEEESQRISFALQLKPPSQNSIYLDRIPLNLFPVLALYIRTYIHIDIYIHMSVSVIHLLCHKKNETKMNMRKIIRKRKTKMHPQLTINILPYIQHHTDLYMQFIMRKSGKLLKLFERNLNSY